MESLIVSIAIRPLWGSRPRACGADTTQAPAGAVCLCWQGPPEGCWDLPSRSGAGGCRDTLLSFLPENTPVPNPVYRISCYSLKGVATRLSLAMGCHCRLHPPLLAPQSLYLSLLLTKSSLHALLVLQQGLEIGPVVCWSWSINDKMYEHTMKSIYNNIYIHTVS